MRIYSFLIAASLCILAHFTQFEPDARGDYTTWEGVKLFPKNVGNLAYYYTNTELEALYDGYAKDFGDIVKAVVQIGLTTQGNVIYALQLAIPKDGETSTACARGDIADYANSQFGSRPAILFTGMHDGNNPTSMLMTLYILKKFIFGYINNDNEYLNLLRNTQVWFIPLLNLDAHDATSKLSATNQFPYLKNLHGSANSQCSVENSGINLKLNYPLYNGNDRSPQHPDECNSLYEGPSNFSEPETQAVKRLVDKVTNLKIAIHYLGLKNAVYLPFNYYEGEDVSKLYKGNDQNIFSEIFNKANLGAGNTYFGNYYKKNGATLQGEVSDYLYNSKGIYSLSVDLGSPGVDTTKILSMTDNVAILNYFYNMSVYSTHKLTKQLEWTQLYQLVEACLDQHHDYISCNTKTTQVYSAKFKLTNYGFSPKESVSVSISSSDPRLSIQYIDVEDSYSVLYNFQDEKLRLAASENNQVTVQLSTRVPAYINVIGVYNSLEKPNGNIKLNIANEYSFGGSQVGEYPIGNYGGVEGFKKIVVDADANRDNIRAPSIVLIIVYFVSLAIIFIFGVCVYGASKFSKSAPKDL